MSFIKLALIAFLCLPTALYAEESPADTVRAILQGFSKGDVFPLIDRLSVTDRKLWSSRSASDIQYIKRELKLDESKTSGWGDYEFQIANNFKGLGVLYQPGPGKGEREKDWMDKAFVRGEWVRGGYAEVDVVAPYTGYKSGLPLVRLILFKENGKWRFAPNASSMVNMFFFVSHFSLPDKNAFGDITDFYLTYAFGEAFESSLSEKIVSREFHAPLSLRHFYYKKVKEDMSYMAYWLATGDISASLAYKVMRTTVPNDKKANGYIDFLKEAPHDRSAKGNQFLKAPPTAQLSMIGGGFMRNENVYLNFIKKWPQDIETTARATFLLGQYYYTEKRYEEAAAAWETAVVKTTSTELQTQCKQELAVVYIRNLNDPAHVAKYVTELTEQKKLPKSITAASAVNPPQVRARIVKSGDYKLLDLDVDDRNDKVYALLLHDDKKSGLPNYAGSAEIVAFDVTGASTTLFSFPMACDDNVQGAVCGNYDGMRFSDNTFWLFNQKGAEYALKLQKNGKLSRYITNKNGTPSEIMLSKGNPLTGASDTLTHLGLPAEYPKFRPAPQASLYEHACGPPDEDCQPDPKGDLYEVIEPAPADD